jgi:hypothetical protein
MMMMETKGKTNYSVRFVNVKEVLYFTKSLVDHVDKTRGKLSCYLHAGAEGERKYRSYSFLTLTLDGVRGHLLAALYPWGKNPRYPMSRRLGRSQSRSW